MARRGFAAADEQRRAGAPLRSAAYPADAALLLRRGSPSWTGGHRPPLLGCCCRWFLHYRPPSEHFGLVARLSVHLQRRCLCGAALFKYGTSGFAPRVAVRIPTPAPGDLIRLVFTRLLALPCARRSDPLFRASDLALATAAGLRAVSAVAPPGALHSPLLAQRRYLSRVRGWRSVGAHNAREQPRVYRGRAAA
jgi:hypothetical protein